MSQRINALRAGSIFLVVLALGTAGCELLPFFDDLPPQPCTPGELTYGEPCGPCRVSREVRICDANGRWGEPECEPSYYDEDGDTFANQLCFAEEVGSACCGTPDCDDEDPFRYPGVLIDEDDDEQYDSSCCTIDDDPRCLDCDDRDPFRRYLMADIDGDGHHDVACGGDDCDDHNPLRYYGHADVDGDGHTDLRCCDPETDPFCDDCDDDDPLRWRGHADLDGDGHSTEACGGDDCDDDHPLRWNYNADVDGDGHQDDRCCPDDPNNLCDDCNDNDPRRWTGSTDLDGDGRNDSRCRCDVDDLGAELCSTFDDCDDDCEDCRLGMHPRPGFARDHDCDGLIDDLWVRGFNHDPPEIVGHVETGDSWAVATALGPRVFVGSTTTIFEIDVTEPTEPEIVSFAHAVGVRDLALWQDLVLAATDDGLVVARRVPATEGPPALTILSRLRETGHSRGVTVSRGYAFVAAYEGLYVVDISEPLRPVIVSVIGDPLLYDVKDVTIQPTDIGDSSELRHTIVVLSRWTASHPETGGITFLDLDSAIAGGGFLPSEMYTQTQLEGGLRIASACGWGFGNVVVTNSTVIYMRRVTVYFTTDVDFDGASGGIRDVFYTGGMRDSAIYTYLATDRGLFWNHGITNFTLDDFVDTGPIRALAISDNLQPDEPGGISADDYIYLATPTGLFILERFDEMVPQ